jgi:TRAP-type C4-dicarboxylate transport system permease large subunit
MTPTDPAVPADEIPPSAPTWAPPASTETPGPPFYPSVAGMFGATAIGPLAMALTGVVGTVLSMAVLCTVVYLVIRLKPRGFTGVWGPRSWSWKPLAQLAIPLLVVFAISSIVFQETGRTWWVPIVVGVVVAVLTLVVGVVVGRTRTRPQH